MSLQASIKPISSVLSGLGISVHHNSPYLLKRADGSFLDPETGERLGFDHRFMSKGEGDQVHGWGSYFSVNDLRRYANFKKDITYKGISSENVQRSIEDPVMAFAIEVVMDHIKDGKTAEQGIKEALEYWNKKGENSRLSRVVEKLHLLEPSDFKVNGERHHYNVEIPDDDGTNYLYEGEPIGEDKYWRVRNALDTNDQLTVFDLLWQNGADPDNITWRDIRVALEAKAIMKDSDFTREDISKQLHDAGFVGVKYDGAVDGECYVIFDENDAKIVGHDLFGVSNTTNTKKIVTALTITIFKSNAFKTLLQPYKRRSTTAKPRLVTCTINGTSLAETNINRFIDKSKLIALINDFNINNAKDFIDAIGKCFPQQTEKELKNPNSTYESKYQILNFSEFGVKILFRISNHNVNCNNIKDEIEEAYSIAIKDRKSKNTFVDKDDITATEYVYFTDNCNTETYKGIAIKIYDFLQTSVWPEDKEPKADKINYSPKKSTLKGQSYYSTYHIVDCENEGDIEYARREVERAGGIVDDITSEYKDEDIDDYYESKEWYIDFHCETGQQFIEACKKLGIRNKYTIEKKLQLQAKAAIAKLKLLEDQPRLKGF